MGPSPLVLDGIPGDAAEIEAEFSAGNLSMFGFEVRRSPTGRPTITVTIERGTLTVGNARAYVGISERYKLRLFLDKLYLEIYVNDGAVALYQFIDALPQDQGIAVFARIGNSSFGLGNAETRPPAGVSLESLRAWPMRPASFSLDHFHV